MKFGNFLFPDCRDPKRDGIVIDETLREARLSDALGDRLSQRGREFAFSDRQSRYLPPGRNICAGVCAKGRQER